MAFSDTIVKFINDSLKAGSLKSKKFQPGAYHGIVTLVARKAADGKTLQLLPGIADPDGNYTTVEPNDKFNVIIYHRTLSNSYQYLKNDSYGDQQNIKATNEMAMLVWVDNKKTQLSPEQLEALFVAGMPQKLTADLKKDLGVMNCMINPLASNMDKLSVFRQEYQNIEFFLRPYHTFFQLRYRAELTFSQGCLTTCGCSDS